MLHINSVKCSPIKPNNSQSFGRNDVLEATADWLGNVDAENLNEDNFNGLGYISDKMHDGPLKTFAKILSIGGAAFFAGKAGAAHTVNKLTNNKIISKNISLPITKFVDKTLKAARKSLQSNANFGAELKGFKSYVVNTAEKLLAELENFGKNGAGKVKERIESQIALIRETSGKKLSDSAKKTIECLNERKKYAATENLINQVMTNTAGVGAGTVAVVEANKDRNKNGIPDIGEHR